MEGLEDIIELFKEEVNERLARVEKELVERKGKDIELLYREFHTIKGTAQMLGFDNYSKAAHMVEDILKPLWKQSMSLPEDFIPKILKVLDIFRSKIGEDLSEEDLKSIESSLKGEGVSEKTVIGLEIISEIEPEVLERVLDISEELMNTLVVEDGEKSRKTALSKEIHSILREIYWSTQTVLLSDLIKGMERLVYEEAKRLGKRVRLITDIENARVKKDIAQPIRDSLVHMVKNAVVHGIESPQERRKIGKEEEGVVRIKASTVGRTVVIRVEDDGRGIDTEKIRRKLEELGKPLPKDGDLMSVIFEPFFSTRDEVDIGAGRGIGLSSVKTFIESVGGSVSVRSRPGEGTVFELRIPTGRIWEEVAVFKTGESLWAVRVKDLKRVILEEGSKKVVLGSGKTIPFDERIAMGSFSGYDNRFSSLEDVAIWVSFMGAPIPVIRP